jgi:hypothetical protein
MTAAAAPATNLKRGAAGRRAVWTVWQWFMGTSEAGAWLTRKSNGE